MPSSALHRNARLTSTALAVLVVAVTVSTLDGAAGTATAAIIDVPQLPSARQTAADRQALAKLFSKLTDAAKSFQGTNTGWVPSAGLARIPGGDPLLVPMPQIAFTGALSRAQAVTPPPAFRQYLTNLPPPTR